MSFEALFQSGDIAFALLAIMLVEALALAVYARRFPGILLGLAAGACLILALRASLLQQSWQMIALFLVMSFVFHIVEIAQWLRLARHQH